MPQGGIDEDEDPRNAAFRELREEIGTDKAEVIAESKVWLRYDLPPEFRKRWDNRWRGQQQKWFVMRFLGVDADIDVATEHPSFPPGSGSRSSGCRSSSSRSSASSTLISCGNLRRSEPL